MSGSSCGSGGGSPSASAGEPGALDDQRDRACHVDHHRVGLLGRDGRPQRAAGHRDGAGVRAPAPDRLGAGERDDRLAAVVADQRRQRHLGFLLRAVVAGLGQDRDDRDEQPARGDGGRAPRAPPPAPAAYAASTAVTAGSASPVSPAGLLTGTGRPYRRRHATVTGTRGRGSRPGRGGRAAGRQRRLLNVVKSMKAVFNRGYRQSPRQNRLSAHAGYGSLLTCGDVQAS